MHRSSEKIERRLEAIREEIADLGPILVGTLLTKHNRKTRRDGSVYVSGPYYTLQYKDAQQRRCWKRVPRSAKVHVQRMVNAGKRYTALEREYAQLSTELALLSASKKTP